MLLPTRGSFQTDDIHISIDPGVANAASYCVSKFGVRGLTQSLGLSCLT